MHRYYVYLLTNKNNKVMYVGVTNNLERRVYEHKKKQVPGFTEKYNVNRLVYFEETQDVRIAIAREKEIKKWRREKKNQLVVAVNPEWRDLSEGWFEISPCGRDGRTVADDRTLGHDRPVAGDQTRMHGETQRNLP
jgi:putative endonuclease